MKRIAVDWSMTRDETDLKPALSRFRRYIENPALKDNTTTFIKLTPKSGEAQVKYLAFNPDPLLQGFLPPESGRLLYLCLKLYIAFQVIYNYC